MLPARQESGSEAEPRTSIIDVLIIGTCIATSLAFVGFCTAYVTQATRSPDADLMFLGTGTEVSGVGVIAAVSCYWIVSSIRRASARRDVLVGRAWREWTEQITAQLADIVGRLAEIERQLSALRERQGERHGTDARPSNGSRGAHRRAKSRQAQAPEQSPPPAVEQSITAEPAGIDPGVIESVRRINRKISGTDGSAEAKR